MPGDREILARAVDVVVVARREALAAPFPLIVEDLARALAVVTRPPSRGGTGAAGRRRRGTVDPAAAG